MTRLITVALTAALSASARAEAPLIEAFETVPTHFQWAKVSDDLPAKDILVESQAAAWFITKGSLWRWDLEEKKFSRFPLVKAGKDGTADELVSLESDGSNLMVASQNGLFMLSFDPYRVLFYPLPAGHERGATVGVVGSGKHTFLIRENGIFEVSPGEQKTTPYLLGIRFMKSDRVLYSEKGNAFWVARNSSLMRISRDGKHSQHQVTTFTAKNPILGLATDGAALYASTRYTVVQLDGQGEPVTSIPVEGEHRLVRMSISGRQHAYLFSDKLFEVYQLDSKKLEQYFVDLGKVKSAGEIAMAKRTVGFIADGKPRVFQLPNRVHPAKEL